MDSLNVAIPTASEVAGFGLPISEWERSQTLVARCRTDGIAVKVQLGKARRLVADSRRLLGRVPIAPRQTLDDGSRFPEVRAAKRAVEAGAAHGSVRTFAAVKELIAQVERSVTKDIDFVERLYTDIRGALASKTDAVLLMGILLEGVVQTVIQRMQLSVRERRDMVIALCAVLADRINPGAD